jgi:hypothetical protein
MSSYLQMGHNTENLVGANDLDLFEGLILSPVNRDEQTLINNIISFRKIGKYDIIFDPQLYFPKSNRGKLPEYRYFPSDFDSKNIYDSKWWENVVKDLAVCSKNLAVDAVASPVIQPKIWNLEYFSKVVDVRDQLATKLSETNIKVLTTIMVDMSQLTDATRLMEIASVVSNSKTIGFYIVFVSNIKQRSEITDA